MMSQTRTVRSMEPLTALRPPIRVMITARITARVKDRVIGSPLAAVVILKIPSVWPLKRLRIQLGLGLGLGCGL